MYLKNIEFNIRLLFAIIILNEMKISKEYKIKSLNLNNEIIITIKGNGTQQILSEYQNNKPSEIIVNNQYKKNIINKYYIEDLIGEINTITIKWNETLSDFSSMFRSLKNILSIDLSNFDASIVTNMESMFDSCSSLKSLNLNNLKTSSVQSMYRLFYDCGSLISLDLGNLDTSSVTTMEGMFYNCSSLKSLDLSNMNTSSVIYMGYMFEYCSSLISLDLSKLNTSSVKSMGSLFSSCSSLISLDLSNLNTSSVINMGYMFSGCYSLKSLDVSKLNTSSVENMGYMFSGCISLTSLDVSKLDTSSVKDMSLMFNDCINLVSLDVSKLDTSSVTDMGAMFQDCRKLTSLDLSNLNTSSVDSMIAMFKDCSSLESLDLSNLNTSSVEYMNSMFGDCRSLISLDLSKLNTSSVTNMEGMFLGSSSLIFLDLSKLDTSFVTDMCAMFSGCSSLKSLDLRNLNTSSVTDMGAMFARCSSLESLDLRNLNTSSVTDMDSMFYGCSSLESLDLSNLDTSSVENMDYMFFGCSSLIFLDLSHFKFNEYLTFEDMFFNCSKRLLYCINEETIMDNDFLSYISEELGNNNCSDICFSENKKIIVEKKKYDDDIYKYEYNKRCYENYLNETYNSSTNNISIEYYEDIDSFYHLFQNNEMSKDQILDNLRYELIKRKLNKLIDNIIIKDKKNMVYKDNNILYELTSTDVDNNDNNISSINLGECEKKLKLNNSIKMSDSLLILKVDIYEIGILIPLIEYEIFNIETKEKLDLSICKNDKIDISIPVNIDENNLYKYNISDDYYNDKCSIKDNDIDIILNDRRNEYYINNMSVCEKDCFFKEYNTNTKKVVCECLIKISFPLISEIEINKDLFMKNLKNISSIMNLDIIKCYKILFTKEGLIKNIGNYILISIILISMVLFLLFIIKGFKKIKNQIEYLIKNRNINKNKVIKKKGIKKQNNNLPKKKKNNLPKNKRNIALKNKRNNPPKNKRNILPKKIKNILPKNKKNILPKNKKNILPKNKRKKNNILKNISNFETINDNSNIKMRNDIKFNNKNELSKLNNYNIKYNDNELNRLDYKDALIIDKRSYMDYYFSLLKTKHIILFTFFNNTDYNSKIIKIYLFLFTFALFLVVNALFFTDSTIHQIYEVKGKYSFINQIPIIFYSSMISSVINTIIKYLSLSENDILKIKYEIKDVIKRAKIILKCLKAKFVLFFILTFILLILFWYYISCFCTIYRNTQIHLMKDTLASYSLSLVYPFIIYIFPGIFRIPSLRSRNKDKECLYKISKYIQLI